MATDPNSGIDPDDAPVTRPLGGTSEDAPTPPTRPAQGTVEENTSAEPVVRLLGYTVIAELGRGAMGVVYHARQEALGREVALKMILAGAHASSQEQQRFLAEARAIASLRHPNIVQIYDLDTHDGLPYFAMEFCSGGTLARRLKERPPSPRESAEMLASLAVAVHTAHEAGIIHRDLKPGNVLLAGDGVLKVGDFGLAKKFAGSEGLTQSGAVVGTPAYMAPEQAQGKKEVGPACDVWALGAILYECLTGCVPFQGADSFDTLKRVLEDEPVPPRKVNPAIPRDLEAICLKCLEKHPSQRYASAGELAADLNRFLAGEAVRARPVRWSRRMARWARKRLAVGVMIAGIAAALVIGLAAGAGLFSDRSKQEQGQGDGSDKQVPRNGKEKDRIAVKDKNGDKQPDDVELRRPSERRKLGEVYYGVESCSSAGCHGGSPPRKWVNDPDGKPLDLLSRCDEAVTWKKMDKHADAWNVLTKERGKQMAKILGYDVTKAPECLACHAVVIKDETVRKASVAAGFDVKEGVTCVVCHGPHVEWVANHGIALLAAAKFRRLNRLVKENEYGMRDLRDPVKRAEVCVSCHVGNVQQGKFLTHKMYAAGHPPLPGFELATFSNDMPRHWEQVRERRPAIQKELGYRKDEQDEPLLVLVGGVIAFRETMKMLADQIRLNRYLEKGTELPLDRATFDCYQCHTVLKPAQPLPKGKPGRYKIRGWVVEPVWLAIEYLAATNVRIKREKVIAEFEQDFQVLTSAVASRSGANNDKIAKVADRLARWADALATRINTEATTSEETERLLQIIVSRMCTETKDYDTAQRASCAAEVLHGAVNYRKKPKEGIQTAFVALDKHLKLRLPIGRGKLIEDELQDNLDRRANHDAVLVRKLFEDLGKALKAK